MKNPHSFGGRDWLHLEQVCPFFSKESVFYTVVQGNSYTFTLVDEAGQELKRKYKYYELQPIQTAESFLIEPRQREPTMTNKEGRNKREIEDLTEHTVEPLHKKRRIFAGTYFLD